MQLSVQATPSTFTIEKLKLKTRTEIHHALKNTISRRRMFIQLSVAFISASSGGKHVPWCIVKFTFYARIS